jgi:hypothetical protein
MSNLGGQAGRMKLQHLFPELDSHNVEVIAAFGHARLIKTFGGKYELVGGSGDERSEAREWISLFMHEVVVGNRETLRRTGRRISAGA